jgi:hypothetical protein
VAKQLPQRSNAHVELSLSSDRDGLGHRVGVLEGLP